MIIKASNEAPHLTANASAGFGCYAFNHPAFNMLRSQGEERYNEKNYIIIYYFAFSLV